MDNFLEFDVAPDRDDVVIRLRIDVAFEYDWTYRDEHGVFELTFTRKPKEDE